MRKGFFISIDLIITFAAIIFLFGILGVYLHSSIQTYIEYKEDAKMEATMNIVMNRLALSDYSCKLETKDIEFIKYTSFCIPAYKDLNLLFEDLDYNVSVICLTKDCFDLPFDNTLSQKYIAKDIFLLVPDSVTLSKQKYFDCTQGNCDINTLVRIYVWN